MTAKGRTERGYAEKYLVWGEPIHLIGVEFSRETHSLVGFEVASRLLTTLQRR